MRVQENSQLVIFGASGDLTARMLVPALVHLFVTEQLPENFFVLGVSRSSFTDEEYRAHLEAFLKDDKNVSQENLSDFLQRVHYHALNTSEPAEYQGLKDKVASLSEQYETGQNTLYYLATPPSLFETIPACLAEQGMTRDESAWKRLIVEKPIGYDLASAEALDKALHKSFACLPFHSFVGLFCTHLQLTLPCGIMENMQLRSTFSL